MEIKSSIGTGNGTEVAARFLGLFRNRARWRPHRNELWRDAKRGGRGRNRARRNNGRRGRKRQAPSQQLWQKTAQTNRLHATVVEGFGVRSRCRPRCDPFCKREQSPSQAFLRSHFARHPISYDQLFEPMDFPAYTAQRATDNISKAAACNSQSRDQLLSRNDRLPHHLTRKLNSKNCLRSCAQCSRQWHCNLSLQSASQLGSQTYWAHPRSSNGTRIKHPFYSRTSALRFRARRSASKLSYGPRLTEKLLHVLPSRAPQPAT